MNTNEHPPYDSHQYDSTVNRDYYDPTQYQQPSPDPSQYKSTQPNQPSPQPPYPPTPAMASDPYATPTYGTPLPSDPYQASNSGMPPHFTGSYAPNPYLPTPPPPPSAISPYGKKLFVGLALTFLLSFLLGYTPDTSSTQNIPVTASLGISLFVGAIICVFVVDWRGFFNLEGLLHWRQMSPNRRLGMGCLFLCFYPIFAFIYAIRAGIKALTGQDRLFTKEWDMPQPLKRRAKIGMISGSVVALFFFVVSLLGNTGASAQGASSTSVTPAATHTSQVNTSTQNQKAITPTPTTRPKPTPSPTATPRPYAHFGDGTFEVGKDIQPGMYRTREASPGCYFARLKGFSGAVDDIIANGNTDAPTVITIASSDKGFQSTNCGTWTQDLSAITNSKTSFDDGIYIVGTDMQPGTYKSSGQSGCYFARLNGFGGTVDDIIANSNTDTAAIVTIAPGDKGFQSTRCGTWTKE